MNDSYPAPSHDITLCCLASGSRGNATYISDGETSILLDSGLSGVEIERRMASRGLSPKDLDGIIVSHEHGDHIRGVGILARRYRIPVYVTRNTWTAIGKRLGRIGEIRHFTCGDGFMIRTLAFRPFSTSHDAEDPAGFVVRRNGTRIGIATDLGIATSVVREHLRNCSLLLLEANHDPEMLINGPYPWHLKQRVKSRTGHLSNPAARALLGELLHDGLRHVILGHISEKNNHPEIALRVVGEILSGSRIRLTVALQDLTSDLIHV